MAVKNRVVDGSKPVRIGTRNVAPNMAMTCCANDIQPIGWITQGIQKPSTKTYFRLTAQCKAVDAQGEKMLMLQEARAEIVPPPEEEYLNFNA